MAAEMIWVRPVRLPWVPDGLGDKITREGSRVPRSTYINRRLADKSLEIFTPAPPSPVQPASVDQGPSPDDEF